MDIIFLTTQSQVGHIGENSSMKYLVNWCILIIILMNGCASEIDIPQWERRRIFHQQNGPSFISSGICYDGSKEIECP